MRLVGRAGAFLIAAMTVALFGAIRANSEEATRVPEAPVNSLQELFEALRRCWEPPQLGEGFRGLQMSVRFSLKWTGELFAPPRVTFISGSADPEAKRLYSRAVDAAFERCMPMPLTAEMAGAVAGRPISIRFVYGSKDEKYQ